MRVRGADSPRGLLLRERGLLPPLQVHRGGKDRLRAHAVQEGAAEERYVCRMQDGFICSLIACANIPIQGTTVSAPARQQFKIYIFNIRTLTPNFPKVLLLHCVFLFVILLMVAGSDDDS